MVNRPDEVPEDQVLVQQVGVGWQVTQPNRPIEWADTLTDAIAKGVAIFRERRTAHLMILPPDSPYMWD